MLKIAVVDDEQGILLSLSLFLEMEGYSPLVFTSPLKALEVLSKEKVDLIIIDMRMPEMSGEEMALCLRKNPFTKNIPIILFSAHETLPEVASRVGAQGILEKPFQFEKLNRMIKSVTR
ncbi:MAG: response regulator [Peptococcaceae bacterium]|jgi:CheY-like chemotaxis protein|nr:response regulator [Peptococcaceae bacterium]MDH7523831.1 response regulator [Peptococcaceae bacterium]